MGKAGNMLEGFSIAKLSNKKLILTGGKNDQIGCSTLSKLMNMKTGKWSRRPIDAELQTGRAYHASCTINMTAYVFGGISVSNEQRARDNSKTN